MGKLKKRTAIKIVMYAVLIAYTVICLYPIVWTLISSLKSNTGILMDTMALPDVLQWKNYAAAWEGGNMVKYYINTIFVTIVATVLNLVITSMATYVLARVRPSMPMYTYYVVGLILPVYVVMLPMFKILTRLGLNNTFWGLILIYTVVNIPQTFFILYGYMKDGIPYELEEAARIDGCSRLRIFTSIVVPLSKPGLATVGIFTLLFCWNEYLLPLILMSGDNMVLSVAIRQFQATFTADYGAMTARLAMSFIPVVILYIIFQKSVIAGVTAGSVKG